jgi:uncharacterized protein HemY
MFNRQATETAMKDLRIKSLINKAKRYERSAQTYTAWAERADERGDEATADKWYTAADRSEQNALECHEQAAALQE